jgi:hypothetical protein
MTGWANCDSVSKWEEIFSERFLKLRPLVGEIYYPPPARGDEVDFLDTNQLELERELTWK